MIHKIDSPIISFKKMVKHLIKDITIPDFNPRFPPKSRIFFVRKFFNKKIKTKKNTLKRVFWLFIKFKAVSNTAMRLLNK